MTHHGSSRTRPSTQESPQTKQKALFHHLETPTAKNTLHQRFISSPTAAIYSVCPSGATRLFEVTAYRLGLPSVPRMTVCSSTSTGNQLPILYASIHRPRSHEASAFIEHRYTRLLHTPSCCLQRK